MRQVLGCLFAMIAVLLPSVAAAEDFAGPGFKDYEVGKATYSQVVQKMGDSGKVAEIERNGSKVKTLKFHYSQSGRYSDAVPAQEGLSPFRTAVFYFVDDVLVGQEFFSSYKSDSTDFDETKSASIVKYKTTREEIEKLIPNPTAKFISPMIKAPSVEAIAYQYSTVRREGFGLSSKTTTSRKSLVIHFDDKGIVVNYMLNKKTE